MWWSLCIIGKTGFVNKEWSRSEISKGKLLMVQSPDCVKTGSSLILSLKSIPAMRSNSAIWWGHLLPGGHKKLPQHKSFFGTLSAADKESVYSWRDYHALWRTWHMYVTFNERNWILLVSKPPTKTRWEKSSWIKRKGAWRCTSGVCV